MSAGRRAEVAPLDVTVPADAAYLSQLRQLVRTYARMCGAPDERIADMILASNEACGNVVVHAYGDELGPLHLRAWLTDTGLAIEVSDNGTPVAKPVEGRLGGHGLHVIREVCDDVDIEGPGAYGTRLEMLFRYPAMVRDRRS